MASSFFRFLDHTRYDSSGRVIRSSQRPLPDSTTLTKEKFHAPGGIRTHILSRSAAADLHLRPRGHCDWLNTYLCLLLQPYFLARLSDTITCLTHHSYLQHTAYCPKDNKSPLRYSTALFTAMLHVISWECKRGL
jgi:hypothetical protein